MQNDADIIRTLETICEGRLTEVRVFDGHKIFFGYFDDYGKVPSELRKQRSSSVYYTFNEIDPDLKGRAYNKLRYAVKGDTTGDQHVRRIRWLPIDLDPKRVANISSSDEEKLESVDLARLIYRSLKSQGWPEPFVGDSGNGTHLLYKVDLEVADVDLIARCLERLDERFSNAAVEVDIKCKNPARIFKLYGTMTSKGDGSVSERPHRLSRILRVPDAIGCVPRELLEALAGPKEEPEPRQARNSHKSEFDGHAWIRERNVEVIATREVNGRLGPGLLYSINCPFNPEHVNEAQITVFNDGRMSASCFHNSCQWKWKELRQHFEPGCYDQRQEQPKQDTTKPQRDENRKPEIKPAEDLMTAALRNCDLLDSGGEQLIRSGIDVLDHSLQGGFAPGELVLIAARPSHGKSMFALQLLHHLTQQHPALIISEEMSAISLGKRAIQFITDSHQEYWFRDVDKIREQICDHFADRQTTYILESCRTSQVVADNVRHYVAKYGVKYVVVDYVQMLNSAQRGRYENVTESSLALRNVVNETGVLMFALAQLSRDIEKRDKFIPRASDLKESGQLEQDADVILSLAWPYKLDASQPRDKYQIFCCKNRNRGIERPLVECKFNPARQMISPADDLDIGHVDFGEYAGN